jgi:hypothetical protein
MEPGRDSSTGSERQTFTADAFLASGTIQRMCTGARRAGIVKVIACFGTLFSEVK